MSHGGRVRVARLGARVPGCEQPDDELTTTDANQVWLVSGGAVVETEFDARESWAWPLLDRGPAGGEAAENADAASRRAVGRRGGRQFAMLLPPTLVPASSPGRAWTTP